MNSWIGSPAPNNDKPPNTFRLVFNNINSLGAHQFSHSIQQLAETQSMLDIDFLGFTEHCLNISQPRTRSTLTKSLNQHFLGKHAYQFDSSNLQTISPYLPGGTALLLLGPIIGRIAPNSKGGDPMGRWSYITLRRRAQAPLTIYTVYKVNGTPTNAVGITAWHQQRLQLDAQNRYNEHPRDAFTTDLINVIRKHQANGHDIIIGGDFNDTLFRPRSQLLKLATSTNLTDPWIHHYPDFESFSTYARGSTRIDSVLCSHSLIPHIRSISYSPYNWLTTSDHRALVIDFDSVQLYGSAEDPLHQPHLRGIKSNDRENVSTFVLHWYDHLKNNNFFDRIAKLNDDPVSTPSSEAEALDHLIGQGSISAEKKCKRRRLPLFSSRLAQLRATKSIVFANLSSLKQGRQQTLIFQSRIQRHGLDIKLATEPVSAYQQYKQVRTELQQLLLAQRTLRQKEQSILIERAMDSNRRDQAKVIENIQKQEARRHTWQTLRFVRNQHGITQKLDRIDIPTSWLDLETASSPQLHDLEDPKRCTEWTTVTKPEDVEYYLQLRNRGHFSQAQGTPFTESPFLESLNWSASTDLSEHILAGCLDTTITDVPQCQALLDACRAVSDLDLLPDVISPEEFKGKIQSWRETTSTSPSGRHLGGYKALFAPGPFRFDPEGDPDENSRYLHLKHAQQKIAESIVALINYCIRTGHVLERWKTIVNTMIFKESGNYKIHKLRVIHIYEADFNLLLAIKWRQLLHSADQRQLLNPGQYGGRPGCEAQSLTLLEELKYDISYTTRRTLFNFDNDATSCYDRIIVSLASLINRKYGLHRHVVLVHANTLQSAQFHLRTQFGYTTNSYSHSIEFPIYGSGQGSGNSPSIWLFISSTLYDVHQHLSHGANFVSPDGTESVRITMVGFVDDSTGTCNDFQPQSQADIATITSRMEHDAQVWNDLLWCSGGKLELPKCSFHALYFNFLPNGTPKPVIAPFPSQIQIVDAETNDRISISHKLANEAHKTLGHWKAPASLHNKEQFSALIHKARSFTTLLHLSQLSRFGSTLAYHGIYLAALKFVLPQCFFSERDLDRAERQSLPVIIAKCGYNRNTALALRYAPLSHAGCGFIRWSTLQGEGQITLFLKHWRTATMLSQTLRVALWWSQWQSGISRPVLQRTRITLPHLECRWIKSLRSFLKSIHASIIVDSPRVVPPERENDIYIMEYAIRSKLFSADEIKIINYCRQYLHVTTTSELFDTQGLKILPHMFQCKRPPWFDTDQFVIIQRKPSDYQIRYRWQKFCRLLSSHDGTAAAFLQLGAWTHRGLKLRTRRESYITSTHEVYHWIDTQYWLLTPIRYTNSYYHPSTGTDWNPDDTATPITLSRIPTSASPVFFTVHIPLPLPIAPIPTDSTFLHDFQDYVETLPLWERSILRNIQFHYGGAFSTMEYLHDLLPAEPALFEVSDGSMTNHSTSFGWVIGTPTGQRLAWGHGPGFGPATSHRAECWGKLSAARFLHHLSLFTNRPFPARTKISSLADNQGMITSLNNRLTYDKVYPNATLKPDWDLLEEIHMSYQRIPGVSITFGWIKGHQDHDIPYARLPVPAQYNVFADTLANDFMESDYTQRPLSPLVPTARCILRIGNATIHSHYTTTIRKAASIPPLFNYLRSKYNWSRPTINDIHWDWFQLAASNYPHTDKNHLMKLVYEQLPTTQAYKAKQGGQTWLPTTCRHCSQENNDESFDHLLFRCDTELSITFRRELPLKVLQYCKKRDVPHNFQVTLIIALEQLLHGRQPFDTNLVGPAVKQLIHAQNRIGWQFLFRGFFSTQWRKYMEFELHHNASARAPDHFDYDHFFSGLIKLIWEQQSNFWTKLQQALHEPAAHQQEAEEGRSAKIAEHKLEIRYLYSLKSQVLPQHQEEYFPHQLSDFLTRSTPSQLQHYITNYKPAIKRSLRAAKKRSTQSHPIFTFPGFTRQAPKGRGPSLSHPSSTTPNHSSAPPAPTHHERTVNTSTATPSDIPPTARAELPSTVSTSVPNNRLLSPYIQTGIYNSVRATTNAVIKPAQRRERPPHKHSRCWKGLQAAQTAFMNFFTKLSPSPAPTSHSPP